MNITLGATHEVDPDQTGVPEGAIRLKSGNIYRMDAQGRPIIPAVTEGAPVSIQSFSRTVNKPSGESETETTKTAVDSSTGETVAEHKTVVSSSGQVLQESKSGDVALLGVEPEGLNLGPLLIGAGLLTGAYFMFKG